MARVRSTWTRPLMHGGAPPKDELAARPFGYSRPGVPTKPGLEHALGYMSGGLRQGGIYRITLLISRQRGRRIAALIRHSLPISSHGPIALALSIVSILMTSNVPSQGHSPLLRSMLHWCLFYPVRGMPLPRRSCASRIWFSTYDPRGDSNPVWPPDGERISHSGPRRFCRW
jgi:hypothetical protein